MAKFVLSKSKVLEQYSKVNFTRVSFSSKTNPLISRILEEETDCLFSIHLINELNNIKDKSRALFLAQAWDEELISKLVNYGITKFVVDNEPDLEVLLAYLESSSVSIDLMLRIKLKENTIKTEKYFVFGMSSETVNSRIKELKENFKILELGVHFHRKTQNMSEWNLKFEVSHMLTEETLKNIDIINIGGGLPSEYANTNVKVLESILFKIKEFKEFLKNYNIDLMLEPGRFIAAPAGKLKTRIIGIYENNIIVDASVYNSDLDALIVPVKLKVEGELEKGTPYVIKGVTPCSLDLFRYRVYLDNPKVGAEITFLNAGAYNFTTDFCNLDKLENEILE